MSIAKVDGGMGSNQTGAPASPERRSFMKGAATLAAGFASPPLFLSAATAQQSGAPAASGTLVPFTGSKIDWHGYDRYDFVIDSKTLVITPFDAPAAEGTSFAIGSPQLGQRRCAIVVPKTPAAGSPWSWRGCYWNHQPQAEVELLRRGFHIAYISADQNLHPDNEWDAWYAFLTQQHGLAVKPVFIGMSRGGEFSYDWATSHPDKVTAIYADNPGMDAEAFAGLGPLAKADVPVLQICGSIDPIFGIYGSVVEAIYSHFGGRISMTIKEGYAHHPHSLVDPKPIADFLEDSFHETPPATPAFVTGNRVARTAYYGNDNDYRYFADEKTYVTLRGPRFAGSYYRYSFALPGAQGATTVSVPNTVAPGTPWVYRIGFGGPDAKVDLALLAKGFHIVTGVVGTNFDGPLLKDWDQTYQHLTSHGFAAKAVMEGGGGAGEIYEWAINNPDKVACIYAENPELHCNLAKTQPLDNLAPLAQAKVPILHVCGSEDPWLKDNTLVLEQRYKALGGPVRVILKKGVGHFPTGPEDLAPVLDFITQTAAKHA